MPYIQPNSFYAANKIIKPYECAMLVVEGPNLKGKMNLDGLEIKYENFALTQLTLNPESKDQPMLYGFLGNNITFLMVKAKFLPVDPNWAVESEQYIEYYFSDDPTKVRQMGQLMILSGNSAKRIPQIYFNNPNTKFNVYLDVLMANLAQDDLTNLSQYSNTSSFDGLYYNSIISDKVIYQIPTGTGSTELIITDPIGNPIMVIPYINIRTISKIDPLTLLIGLDTEEKVKLGFLSEYNTDQANARINWVLKSQRYRILTPTSPSMDIIPPVINWKTLETGVTYSVNSGATQVYFPSYTGVTFTPTDLKTMFIQSIYDNMDGNIDVYDSSVLIYLVNDIVPLTGISEGGIYDLYFSITDLAGNISTYEKYLYVSNMPPTIIFKQGYTYSGFTMALNDSYRSNITPNAVRDLTVDSVFDYVDKDLTIYDIVIASNGFTGFTITETGLTNITYTLTNKVHLSGQTAKEMKIILPSLEFMNMDTGNTTFVMSLTDFGSHIKASDVISYTVSAIVDELDPNISSNNIVISGVTFFVTVPGTYFITYTIVDVHGSHNSYNKTMIVVA